MYRDNEVITTTSINENPTYVVFLLDREQYVVTNNRAGFIRFPFVLVAAMEQL